MLTLDQVRSLKNLLLSNRLTITGDELMGVGSLANALDQEEKRLALVVNQARVVQSPAAEAPPATA